MTHPDLLATARLAKANDHGPLGTPESIVNHERALMLASIEECDHCVMYPVPTPAAAQRWIVEHVHDPDCPKEQQ